MFTLQDLLGYVVKNPQQHPPHSDSYGDTVYICSREFILGIGREEPEYRCSVSGLCCMELCIKHVMLL